MPWETIVKFAKTLWKAQGKTDVERAINTGSQLKQMYEATKKEQKKALKHGYKQKVSTKVVLDNYGKHRNIFAKQFDVPIKFKQIPSIDEDDDPADSIEVFCLTLKADMKKLEKIQTTKE